MPATGINLDGAHRRSDRGPGQGALQPEADAKERRVAGLPRDFHIGCQLNGISAASAMAGCVSGQ
jgi:hypothetical protein